MNLSLKVTWILYVGSNNILLVSLKRYFFTGSVNSTGTILLLVLGMFFQPKKYNLINSCAIYLFYNCVFIWYIYFSHFPITSVVFPSVLKFYSLNFVLIIIKIPRKWVTSMYNIMFVFKNILYKSMSVI